MLKLSCSIRFLLVADVSADSLQFEAHGGNRIAASPEMFAREVALFARESGHRNGTLPFQKPDYGGDRVLGGNRHAHMHMVGHQVPFHDLALLLLGQSMEDWPQLTADSHKQHAAPPLGNKHNMVFAVPFRMG